MKSYSLLIFLVLSLLGLGAALTFTVQTDAQGSNNVASSSRGAIASASSSQANGNYPPSAANNDDRKGQNWGTPSGGWNDATEAVYAADWAQVNFKSAHIIDEIDVYTLRDGSATKIADPTISETFNTATGTGQGIVDFDIQYKSGKGWKTVTCPGDGAVPCGRITDNNLVWRKVRFSPVKTDAVRVAVHKSVTSSANNYSRIVEIEAYGKLNVALAANGAVATASSTTSPSEGLGNYEPVSAINGDHLGIGTGASYSNNTFWRDGTPDAYPDWLQVDFAGKRSIDEVHVYTMEDDYAHPIEPTEQTTFTQYGITNFEVQYWDSGQWWTIPGASVTGNNKVWKKFEFPAVYTDKIRVLVNQALFGRSRIVEVEAYATNATYNVAWQKNATQSSTAAGATASRAVDGNRNGNFFAGSVTHSDYQAQPWWQVDLGASDDIDTIFLFNRTDCACPERLANFYVLVSDQPFGSSDLTTTLNQPGVSSYYTPGGAGPSMSINVGRPGRYVRVQLVGTNFLSLAEVEVLGRERTNYAREGLTQPLTINGGDQVWMDDGVPAGAVKVSDSDGWNFISASPAPYSAALSHQSALLSGPHQHFFHSATQTLSVNSGDSLVAYVYLDPASPPREVMLQWYENGSWDHRAYWGENLLPWATNGSAGLQYVGPLPATGQWVRLEVPARQVGLENKIVNGMAFTLFDGHASWDHAGKSISRETVWSDDAVPSGAATWADNDTWNWTGTNPAPLSGTLAHQSNIFADWHQHYFYGATQTLSVNAGDKLFAYVYVDAANPPRELMLQWNENGSWEHRAYWGENLLPWGVDGLASRKRIGPLPFPVTNQWVRLEVPASAVGLEGKTLNGMAFALFGGRATWDYAGKISQAPAVAAPTSSGGATVTVSSQFSNNYPANAIIDGDRTGFNWSKGGYGSGWNDAADSQNVFSADNLTIDFGATKSINEVRVFTLQDNYQAGQEPSPTQTFSTADNSGQGITYFEVLSSIDGVNWTRVPNGLVLNNNLVRRVVSFPATDMRYVRVAVRDAVTWTNISNNYSRIVEVEAYEATPAITISVDDVTVTEPSTGTLEGNFNVRLSAASSQPVSVSYTPVPNTASYYSDFFMTGFDTITFQPGETSKNVQFFVFSDAVSESTENFFLNLSNPTNATMADGQAICTINDSIPPPTPAISIDNETVVEGNAGSTVAFFSVTLSNAYNQTVSVNYVTANGTAVAGTQTSGADYQAKSGTLTFLPGETSQAIAVEVWGDSAPESDETFNVNLWSPVNATIADGQGIATIANDDAAAPQPAVSISDVTLTEGNSGSTNAVFTVTLSTYSVDPVAVDYLASDEGGVDNDEDFTGVSGQLIFFSGETSKTIEVPVIGDTEPEGDEMFSVNLSNPVNCSIADYQGVGTIVDDDGELTQQSEPAQTSNCTDVKNGQQNVGLSNCADASASSSRGSFGVNYINDGNIKQGKTGTLYWSDAHTDFNDDWVQLTFKNGTIQKLAVIRLFFQQDTDPAVEPKVFLTSKAAMREFDVVYKTSHSPDTPDHDSEWKLLKNVQAIKDPAGNDLPGNVRVAMTFRDVTDVAKIRIRFKKGGLDGNNYSRLVELEAWRTAPPHDEDENIPDPGGLLADLDWAMKEYAGPAPHAKWEKRLDWNYSRWQESSENWGILAHAIALWKDAPWYPNDPNSRKATDAEKLNWWKTVLKCQLGATCTPTAPKIRYFKGSEIFSSDYDASVTLAVAAVHYWAARIKFDSELELLARSYLRATFGAYALAAGNSHAQQLKVDLSATEYAQGNCQTASGGVFFAGPFITMAGMRSPASALCQDDRGPLFNRAIERNLASDQNKREAIEKRLVGAYIQEKWGNQDVNVYGLNNAESGADLSDANTSKLWRHINGTLAHDYILSNMFQWTSGSTTYYIRTIVPYHFLGWGATTPVRMTVMEDNLNANTAPTYAVKYDASTLTGEALYPWVAQSHRHFITHGYGRMEPSAANPSTVRASNIDADDGDVVSAAHGERIVTMSGTSSPQYHVILSPNCRPRLLSGACVP